MKIKKENLHLKEAKDLNTIERQKSSVSNLGRVLSSKDSKAAELDGVINVDPVMGGAYIDSIRNNEKENEILDPIEELINKEGPEFGAKEQPKPKRPVFPKVELDESLFTNDALVDDDYSNNFFNGSLNEEVETEKPYGEALFAYINKNKANMETLFKTFVMWLPDSVVKNFMDSLGIKDENLNEALITDYIDEKTIRNIFKKNNKDIVRYEQGNIVVVKEGDAERFYKVIINDDSELEVFESSIDGRLYTPNKSEFVFDLKTLNEETNLTVDDLFDDEQEISDEERRKVFDSLEDDTTNFNKASKFDKIMMELSPDNISNQRLKNKEFFNVTNKDRYSTEDLGVDFDDNGNTFIIIKAKTEDKLKFAEDVANFYKVEYEKFAPNETAGFGSQYPRDKYIIRIKLKDEDL